MKFDVMRLMRCDVMWCDVYFITKAWHSFPLRLWISMNLFQASTFTLELRLVFNWLNVCFQKKNSADFRKRCAFYWLKLRQCWLASSVYLHVRNATIMDDIKCMWFKERLPIQTIFIYQFGKISMEIGTQLSCLKNVYRLFIYCIDFTHWMHKIYVSDSKRLDETSESTATELWFSLWTAHCRIKEVAHWIRK